MSLPLQQVASSPELPKSADAVVIGAGIVGVFAAYYLAKRGLRVALLEKGSVGAEQSGRNWGWCRQQTREARELPIPAGSLELRERFASEKGEAPDLRRSVPDTVVQTIRIGRKDAGLTADGSGEQGQKERGRK